MTDRTVRHFRSLDVETRRQVWDLLNSRQYYLMVGSGVSLDSTGLTGAMRSASQLNTDLCKLTDLPPHKTLQQAYSLLEPDQKRAEITEHYQTKVPGSTIGALSQVPWRRIYTLNVDNAFEVQTRLTLRDRLLDISRLQVVNYVDDYQDTQPDTIHSVVHLHGSVERPDDGYVFSYTEYSQNISRPNSWMSTLTQLLRSEPFIVAGTTLDEVDVTYYLEQRPPSNHVFNPEAPSILIEPYPDRLTRRLCESHDFVLFEGTTLEFIESLSEEFGFLSDPFSSRDHDAFVPPARSEADRIRFLETFEKVPANPVPAGELTRFLLGASPTWEMLAGNVDVRRDIFSRIDRAILDSQKSGINFVVILDDPGSGKSSVLRKIALSYAKKMPNVFFFKGREYLEDSHAADIFQAMNGHVYIFADNLADNISYLVGILQNVKLDHVTIVGTERKYRRRYIEDAVADFDAAILDSELDLSVGEARRLIRKHKIVGLSDIDTTSDSAVNKSASLLAGDPISIATCRIQNNFFTFDRIIRELILSAKREELRTYAAIGIARYCYAGGVSKDILSSMPGLSRNNRIGDGYSRLPVQHAIGSRQFVVPARTAVSERVIEVLRSKDQMLLLDTMVSLANALAPKVNRSAITRRTPEAKLAGGLLDFDRTVQRFVNDRAEAFYSQIHDNWEWNSRYWEQLSLLKLDRYFHSRDDDFLLQEAIQNARYAYSIEQHPLSLTTLAKTLFSALEARFGSRDSVFTEAWSMITQSINIERHWDRIRSTAFIVCFKGVKSYYAVGGTLSGSQADELRDIVAITHSRGLKDKRMHELRAGVVDLIG